MPRALVAIASAVLRVPQAAAGCASCAISKIIRCHVQIPPLPAGVAAARMEAQRLSSCHWKSTLWTFAKVNSAMGGNAFGRPVQHLFGKVKLLGELRLGYSNAAFEFACREPDRNGQPGHISKEDCRVQ